MRKCGAEFIGTFGLVFAGTGAIVINEVSGGAITQVGIALTFRLIVLAMIYTVGDISGAHLNPAFSLGFFAARRFPLRSMFPYILSQCAGAFAASGILWLLFPNNATLGQRAIELDPLSPIINADMGQNLSNARRYDEAIAQLRKTLEIDPTFYYAHYNLGIERANPCGFASPQIEMAASVRRVAKNARC